MTKEERITYWRGVIKKHATSSLSAAVSSREYDISIHQFSWWKRRFGKDNPNPKNQDFFN